MGYTKIVRSGNLIELYEYEKHLPDRRRKPKKDNGRYRAVNKRRVDNVQRCRKNFLRLVRSNLGGDESPVFLTLTMFEILRVDVAFRCFTEFVARFRRKYGHAIRYIGVPEFQERGAVHFHVLVWGLKEKDILIEGSRGKTINQKIIWLDWLNAKGYSKSDLGSTRSIQHLWARGFVDCIPTDGSPKLAGYLAKYMYKTMFDERLRKQKAYMCSGNVLRPMSLKTNTSVNVALDQWGVKEIDLKVSKVFSTLWLGTCKYKSYVVE